MRPERLPCSRQSTGSQPTTLDFKPRALGSPVVALVQVPHLVHAHQRLRQQRGPRYQAWRRGGVRARVKGGPGEGGGARRPQTSACPNDKQGPAGLPVASASSPQTDTHPPACTTTTPSCGSVSVNGSAARYSTSASGPGPTCSATQACFFGAGAPARSAAAAASAASSWLPRTQKAPSSLAVRMTWEGATGGGGRGRACAGEGRRGGQLARRGSPPGRGPLRAPASEAGRCAHAVPAPPPHLPRVRALADKVPDQHQVVDAGRKADLGKQRAQLRLAAVDVALAGRPRGRRGRSAEAAAAGGGAERQPRRPARDAAAWRMQRQRARRRTTITTRPLPRSCGPPAALAALAAPAAADTACWCTTGGSGQPARQEGGGGGGAGAPAGIGARRGRRRSAAARRAPAAAAPSPSPCGAPRPRRALHRRASRRRQRSPPAAATSRGRGAAPPARRAPHPARRPPRARTAAGRAWT
jgi:hypothetical protein